MAGLLFGIAGFDGVTFVTAVAALLAVTLAASVVPARRVASIDTVSALRTD